MSCWASLIQIRHIKRGHWWRMCGKVEGRGRRWRLGNSLVEHMERRIYDLYEVMFTRDTGKEKLLRDMYMRYGS